MKDQLIFNLEDLHEWRYEYDNYRHTIRMYTNGERKEAFYYIPDDQEERKAFWASMVGRGLGQDQIEKAERSIIEKDQLPFS